MAHTLKAARQSMQQKAPEAFHCIEGHDPLARAVPVVFPAKGDLPLFQLQQAVVGDGHAIGVTGQIPQHLLGSRQRFFGVYHPLYPA
jgi:hypothetical protein